MSDHYVCKNCDKSYDKCNCKEVAVKICEQSGCDKPAEAERYKFCYDCWWKQDPRNKDAKMEDMQDKNKKFLDSIEKEGPQPGPPAPSYSMNGRFIVESYKEDRGLKATVNNGFALVSQKVNVKGMKLLMDVRNADGGWIAYRGALVYIREEYLHSQPWAKKSFTSDGIEGEFMIVEPQFVEFVVPR